jgi:hypothetical protein
MRNLLVEGDLGTARQQLPELKLRLTEMKATFAGEAK